MKTRKVFLAIFVVTIAILLSGCNNESDTPTYQGRIAGIVVESIENGDFRGAIIQEIHTARSMSVAEFRNNGNYEAHRIAETTEFYFPHIEIEGLELRKVSMFNSTLVYFYAPLDASEVELSLGLAPSIEVFLDRPDYLREQGITELFRESLVESVSSGFGIETDSGMMYSEKHALILAPFGDGSVRIDVTEHFNRYETLRDIAQQVIDTAELVRVG
jgi:hypothetical protein